MLTLTLVNDDTLEITENKENAIRNINELNSLFSGTAAIKYNDDPTIGFQEHRYDFSDMLFELEPGINPTKEYGAPYQRIKDATWTFANGYVLDGFKSFVQDEMNKHSKDSIYWCHDVITHGCASGTVSSLIYTSDCLKVLAEHASDIENKINQIGEDFGESYSMNYANFSFDKLIWMCFEETVRDVLSNLQLDDI